MKQITVQLRIHYVCTEMPFIINDENVIIASGQGKKPVSILRDEFCGEQVLPYLPKRKFG